MPKRLSWAASLCTSAQGGSDDRESNETVDENALKRKLNADSARRTRARKNRNLRELQGAHDQLVRANATLLEQYGSAITLMNAMFSLLQAKQLSENELQTKLAMLQKKHAAMQKNLNMFEMGMPFDEDEFEREGAFDVSGEIVENVAAPPQVDDSGEHENVQDPHTAANSELRNVSQAAIDFCAADAEEVNKILR